MLASTTYVLIIIFGNSGGAAYGGDFNDEKACKTAMSAVGYDSTAHRFRNLEVMCVPKSTPEQPKASSEPKQ
jgi:hypothetical protein